MPNRYPTEPTGRIDTTITQVAVRRGDSSTMHPAAARYVKGLHPDATVLAIWPAHERDANGNPVLNVEWEGEVE